MNKLEKTVGLTKDAGWEFGLRKTFSFPKQHLWDFIFSEEGLRIWLGEIKERLEEKSFLKTKDDIEVLVKVFKPYSHTRMTWKKKDWNNTSTLQVRVIGTREKATISFHHEKLSDHNQREEMKQYWNEKMAQLDSILRTGDLPVDLNKR